MKIKTTDLSGAALDWAVAKCEGIDVEYWCNEGPNDAGIIVLSPLPERGRGYPASFSPSTNWVWGGRLIERERITLDARESDWQARIWDKNGNDFIEVGVRGAYCKTALVAAMRCYVLFKMGDEVEVPDEIPSQELI